MRPYRFPSSQPLAQPSDLDPKFGLTLPFAEVGRYGIVTLCAAWVLLLGLWGSSFASLVAHPSLRTDSGMERSAIPAATVAPLASGPSDAPSGKEAEVESPSRTFVLEAAPPLKRR